MQMWCAESPVRVWHGVAGTAGHPLPTEVRDGAHGAARRLARLPRGAARDGDWVRAVGHLRVLVRLREVEHVPACEIHLIHSSCNTLLRTRRPCAALR
jgi:hypothetical protein